MDEEGGRARGHKKSVKAFVLAAADLEERNSEQETELPILSPFVDSLEVHMAAIHYEETGVLEL